MSSVQLLENLCNSQAKTALPAMQIRVATGSFAPSIDGIAMALAADDVFPGSSEP
jgi:hypothetical protein